MTCFLVITKYYHVKKPTLLIAIDVICNRSNPKWWKKNGKLNQLSKLIPNGPTVIFFFFDNWETFHDQALRTPWGLKPRGADCPVTTVKLEKILQSLPLFLMSFGSGQQNIPSTNESNHHSHIEPYESKKKRQEFMKTGWPRGTCLRLKNGSGLV